MWPIDCPSNTISPSLGSIRRQIIRDVVLLPDPDSPTRPTLSPPAIVIEKSATAAAPSSKRFASLRTKRFDEGAAAVADFSMTMAGGESVGLVSESGSG